MPTDFQDNRNKSTRDTEEQKEKKTVLGRMKTVIISFMCEWVRILRRR